MSVTFQPVRGRSDHRPLVRCTCEDMTCPACRLALNLNERNWRDLLAYLGLEIHPDGEVEAPRLAGLCRSRLAMVEAEEEIQTVERSGAGGCLVIEAGRHAGYLRTRTEELLEIALAAGDGWVGWG